MLANAGTTLPKGHALVETYAFSQIQRGFRFDGSLTYLLYGVTDRLTVGAKPLFGRASSSGRTANPGFGDLTLTAQYRLTNPNDYPAKPSVAISLQQSLPTGRFDKLDGFRGTALGSGADTTTVSLYAQQLFWLPNGRILRGRLNLSGAWSNNAKVRGQSVYGTPDDFTGKAHPGAVYVAGVSGEYSLTREWVLALDVVLTHARHTKVSGRRSLLPDAGPEANFETRSPRVTSIVIAPAIEYSWRPNIGVLLAARLIPAWGNAPASITPALALNYVF